MTNPVSSPGDPIFYMHHTWLDRMWWKWQANNISARLTDMGGNNKPRLQPGLFPGLFPPGFNGTVPGFNGTIPGFNGTMNPAWGDMRDNIRPADVP